MNNQQMPQRIGLLDLFRRTQGSQFVIPVYQRNYTWTAGKEVRQYLEDMKHVMEGYYKNHFLGILIYLEKPIDAMTRELSVIDGQQRLTTTFLILYAIRDVYKEQGNFDMVNQLEGQYLTNMYASERVKYKLKPLVADDSVYQCIVADKLDDIEDKNSNVYKNFNAIKQYIRELLEARYTLNMILEAMNQLYIVSVPISEEDNAQKIFESINATGVKLTASDLIRNFILMDLDSHTQEKYYKEYWKRIEDSISPDSKKMELFFRLFLATKNKTLPNKNAVYHEFVQWYKNSGCNTKMALEEVVKYADAYFYVYTKNISDVDSGFRNELKEFRRIRSEMPAPVLLEFYILYKARKISEKDYASIVSLISTYFIRRSLCGLETKSITRLFPILLNYILNDCNGDYSNVVEIAQKDLVKRNAGNSMYMPDNAQMKELMANANMYNLRTTYLRIALDRIEHENNPAPVDLSSLSIEHLMPQTLSQEWLDELEIDEDTYQKNVHRLGNLTLAAKTDNSSMGNRVWEYKNEVLRSTSHLKINQEVLSIDKWTIENIDSRTYTLIERICELYPYPVIKKENLPREAIFINMNEIHASGYLSLDDGSVEVDEGSQLANYDNHELYPNIDDLREELEEDGVIALVDGKMQFVQPYTFYSREGSTALSTAASAILHGSRSGWNIWTNVERICLGNIPEIKNKFS